MLAGLIHGTVWDELEFRLVSSGSQSGATRGGHGGTLVSYHAADSMGLQDGVGLAASSSTGGGGAPDWNAQIVCPRIGLYYSNTGTTFEPEVEVSLSFYGFRAYLCHTTGIFVRWKWDSWKAFVQGVEVASGGADEYDAGRIAPDAWPFLGVPPEISNAAANGPVPIVMCNLSGDPHTGPTGSSTSHVEGGWRYRVGSDWIEGPVSDLTGGWSGDTGTLASSCSATLGSSTITESAKSIYAVPNWPRGVVMMGAEYEALVDRGRRNATKRFVTTVTTDLCGPDGPDPQTEETEETVTPDRAAFLGRYTEAGGVVAETLDDPIHAAATNSSSTWSYTGSTVVGENDTVQPPVNAGWGALGHAHSEALLSAYASPHWRYALHFPASAVWTLDGGAVDSEPYWTGVRQQWMSQPSLPVGERTKHRSTVVAEGLDQSGLVPFWDIVTGYKSPWGVGHFDVYEPDDFAQMWATSKALTNSAGGSRARWPEDHPGTVGSGGMTLPAGTDWVEIALTGFSDAPYMWLALAREIEIPSSGGSNVSGYVVSGVDRSGAVVSLTPGGAVAPGSTVAIGRGNAKGWASDLGDFGQGETADLPVPVAPGNLSVATLSDSERGATFGLASGSGYGRIRIEPVRIDPLLPCTVPWPTFHRAPRAEWSVVPGPGGTQYLLQPDGPGAIVGGLSFFDYLFDTPISTPWVRSPSGAPKIGDLIAWTNAFLLGKPALDTVYARMAAVYEAGFEFAVDKHGWRFFDGETYRESGHSFVVDSDEGPVLCLVNGYRTLPPCHAAPTRKRTTASGWKPTGDWGMWTYSLADPWMRVVAPDPAPGTLELRRGGSGIGTTLSVPSGWAGRRYRIATEGDESADLTLRWRGRDYVSWRPYRGAFLLPGVPGGEGARCAANLSTLEGRFLAGWTGPEGARCRTWNGAAPVGTPDSAATIDEGEDWEWIRFAQDHRGRILVALSRRDGAEATTWECYSDDEGASWSAAEEREVGRFATVRRGEGGGIVRARFTGGDDPGTVSITWQGPGDVSEGAAMTARTDSGDISIEPAGFELTQEMDGPARWILTAIAEGGTEESSWWSADLESPGGGTFTPF